MKTFLRYLSLLVAAVPLVALVLLLGAPALAPVAGKGADPTGAPASVTPPVASLFLPSLARAARDPDPTGKWTRYALPGDAPFVNRIVMSSSVRGWAVGKTSAGGAIWCFNGQEWRLESLPAVGELKGLAVVNDADVWAAGAGISTPGALLHWDGSAWSLTPWSPETLTAIVALSTSDAWTVGAGSASGLSSTVYHWNGSAWAPFPFPVPVFAAEFFSAVAPNDVWLIALGGAQVLHWDGTAWTLKPTAPTPRWGFSMLTSSEGWTAFGKSSCFDSVPRGAPPCSSLGYIGRWNGVEWSAALYTAAYGINDVQAIGPALAWAVGYSDSLPSWNGPIVHTGYLLRWNGQTWVVLDTLPDARPSLLSVVGASDVWAADRGAADRGAAIYHFPVP